MGRSTTMVGCPTSVGRVELRIVPTSARQSVGGLLPMHSLSARAYRPPIGRLRTGIPEFRLPGHDIRGLSYWPIPEWPSAFHADPVSSHLELSPPAYATVRMMSVRPRESVACRFIRGTLGARLHRPTGNGAIRDRVGDGCQILSSRDVERRPIPSSTPQFAESRSLSDISCYLTMRISQRSAGAAVMRSSPVSRIVPVSSASAT